MPVRPMARQELLIRLEACEYGWCLLGDMSFTTVPFLLAQSEASFDFGSEIRVDLSGIDHADSAGLALMLEWLARVRRASGSIRYRNTPAALLNIARVCNVESLLPLEQEAP
jgi:phospholipid transport system transporter-binding protein